MRELTAISEIPLDRTPENDTSFKTDTQRKVEKLKKQSNSKKQPQRKNKPKIGTCCSLTTSCVDDVPGTKCILHECCKSKGLNSCLECPHWANPLDPCHLEKVSRNYCPAVLSASSKSL